MSLSETSTTTSYEKEEKYEINSSNFNTFPTRRVRTAGETHQNHGGGTFIHHVTVFVVVHGDVGRSVRAVGARAALSRPNRNRKRMFHLEMTSTAR